MLCCKTNKYLTVCIGSHYKLIFNLLFLTFCVAKRKKYSVHTVLCIDTIRHSLHTAHTNVAFADRDFFLPDPDSNLHKKGFTGNDNKFNGFLTKTVHTFLKIKSDLITKINLN